MAYMFEKILIANRGEIACRIIRTARKMGIQTVAVFSEADRGALHTRLADEAIYIGAAPARESYLVSDRIIEAALQTGAKGIHPAYGFLSERASFARAVQDEGLIFIGPTPEAIEAMGDKIESKKLARTAGVNTIAGVLRGLDSPDEAVAHARDIGYPIMLKASAGGGGKGMRIAWNDDDVRTGLEEAQREAMASFGDSRVFLEKYIINPRHIEMQILADHHGNIVYLNERECSIQRRHQKVIEEAPSPFLDTLTRQAMGEQAVALARQVGYSSAGTVEFVVDENRQFYFLEMNTRLQVEHPITEMITGLDLVKEMIKIASGYPLMFRQDQVKMNGWAMESRVYAEDPSRQFMPSTGRLVRYSPPAEKKEQDVTVRNDTGVEEGSEISVYYDPMIAKLCTHAPTRVEAIEAMSEALDRFYIEGIAHNIPFLSAIMENPRFCEGRLTTNFIAEEFPHGFKDVSPTPLQEQTMMAVGVYALLWQEARAFCDEETLHAHQSSPLILQRGRAGQYAPDILVSDIEFSLQQGALRTTLNGESITLESPWKGGNPLFEGMLNGASVCVCIQFLKDGVLVRYRGSEIPMTLRTPAVAKMASFMPLRLPQKRGNALITPTAGQLKAVHVCAGDWVEEGQPLAILEAMKMENTLRSDRSGTIKEVYAQAGALLPTDFILIEYEG
jgi:propionyl-CoA carboxylase alpha chain